MYLTGAATAAGVMMPDDWDELQAKEPRAHGGLRLMIAEKQTITIDVLDHETPETIISSVR